MENGVVKKGCVWGTLVVFVLSMAVLALPLAFIATLSGPLHSPQLIGRVICPPGSRTEVIWAEADATRPGEKMASVECVDQQGQRRLAAELDEKTLPAAMIIYYPVCLVPLLAAGAVFGAGFYLLIRRIRQRDAYRAVVEE